MRLFYLFPNHFWDNLEIIISKYFVRSAISCGCSTWCMGSSKEIHKNRIESESCNRLTLLDISPKSDDIFCPRILSKHSLPAKALKKFKYSFMTIFLDYILFYYNHGSHFSPSWEKSSSSSSIQTSWANFRCKCLDSNWPFLSSHLIWPSVTFLSRKNSYFWIRTHFRLYPFWLEPWPTFLSILR